MRLSSFGVYYNLGPISNRTIERASSSDNHRANCLASRRMSRIIASAVPSTSGTPLSSCLPDLQPLFKKAASLALTTLLLGQLALAPLVSPPVSQAAAPPQQEQQQQQQQYSEVGSDVIELLESRANQYFADRDFGPALEIMAELIKLQPNTPRWLEFRAAIRTDAKNFEGALEDYRAGLAMLDRQGLGDLAMRDRARMVSGKALVEEGLSLWQEALDDYDLAMQLARDAGYLDDPYLINSRGNVLASLGRYKEAREEYLKSFEIFQRSKGFRGRGGSTTQRLDGSVYSASNAALMLAELGNEAEALKEIERVARRAPGSEDMRAAQAALYYAQGRTREAEDVWNFACSNIVVGCDKYRDQEWLGTVRRWPPSMVRHMEDFLKLKPVPAQQPQPQAQ